VAHRNEAVRAEPATIGTGRSRDPLGLEIRLLGSLLGQVIAEQAGRTLLDLVERVRRTTIRLRRGDDPALRAGLVAELAALEPDRAEVVVRAFSLYFRLVNLAEERELVREARRAERAAQRLDAGRRAAADDRGPDDSIAAAVAWLRRAGAADGAIAAAMDRLRIQPVLTAHPTEARRRTVLIALRRVDRLLARLAERDIVAAEDRDVRRRLREEITLLWRTADLRASAVSPLDEVRTALAFFDETLFSVVPRIYRDADAALDLSGDPGAEAGTREATDTGRTGTRRPHVRPFLAWDSWIGGDRDGNPAVTAEITERTLRIHADHVFRGYEAVATRLAQTIAAVTPVERVSRTLAGRLARDAELLPDLDRQLRRRYPDEPYRQRFGFVAERLRRTRAHLTGHAAPLTGLYTGPDELDAELVEIQGALAADGLERVAWGDVTDLRWQLATFGFHLASLEVRQHSAAHRRTEAALADGDRQREVVGGVSAAEVIDTFRVIAAAQARYGPHAAGRYVISFTSEADDVGRVLRLAEAAAIASGERGEVDAGTAGHGALEVATLDIVPLFEDAATLEAAGPILAAILADPAYRAHLRSRGDRQEVMLGYSDSNKESGYLAANWLLHRAQTALAATARDHAIELTLFHGRGGAIGRGGGPANRAILGLAAGSLEGRLKLTEQGEVIAANYSDAGIARRHLERLAAATLVASSAAHEAALRPVEASGGPILDELAAASRSAYRALVDAPGFVTFFRQATPIDEIATLRLGSRPAARGRPGGSAGEPAPAADGSIADLRAIPWVFAWSQARIELPGWFGLGSALAAYVARHGEGGLAALSRLYGRWPFFASLVDNAELALARADLGVARQYAALAPDPHGAWPTIEAEYARTVAWLARLTGRDQLLERDPELRRRMALRDPYVDSLSELQVTLLARLRSAAPNDPDRARLLHLVQLTVNGIAAGLQRTG
jgi:phosphoenolpyruvate carboxylase